MKSLLEQASDLLRAEVARVSRERDDAKCEAIRLGRENDAMCDELFAAKQRIAELESELARVTGRTAA